MSTNTLMFTIALNGYHWQYRKNIQSQRAYAERHGYHYVVVDRPLLTSLGIECAWLKVALILEALKANFDWVIFVDADAQMQPSAPAVETLAAPQKYVFIARGYSGRINSGVLIAQQSHSAFSYFYQVLENMEKEIKIGDKLLKKSIKEIILENILKESESSKNSDLNIKYKKKSSRLNNLEDLNKMISDSFYFKKKNL